MADPSGMAKLALRAWLYQIGLFAVGIIIFLAGILVFALALAAAGKLPLHSNHASEWLWVEGGLGLVIGLVCEYRVGRWIGRHAPGHEFSVVCVFGIFLFLQDILINTLGFKAPAGFLVYQIPSDLLIVAVAFAGALRVRIKNSYS